MVTVTDEGRDSFNPSLSRDSIEQLLAVDSYILNMVVNTKFGLQGSFQGPYAIGMNARGDGYYGDNSGNCLEIPRSIVNIPDTGYSCFDTSLYLFCIPYASPVAR